MTVIEFVALLSEAYLFAAIAMKLSHQQEKWKLPFVSVQCL